MAPEVLVNTNVPAVIAPDWVIAPAAVKVKVPAPTLTVLKIKPSVSITARSLLLPEVVFAAKVPMVVFTVLAEAEFRVKVRVLAEIALVESLILPLLIVTALPAKSIAAPKVNTPLPDDLPIVIDVAPEALRVAISLASKLKIPLPPDKPIVELTTEGCAINAPDNESVAKLRLVRVEAVRVKSAAVIVLTVKKMALSPVVTVAFLLPALKVLVKVSGAVLVKLKFPPVVSTAPRLAITLA